MYAHTPRKRFGQNFLIDPFVIQQIVQSIAPQKNQHLVEIGPGRGAITQPLVTEVNQLDVIELDRDLIAPLQHRFAQYKNLIIHQADALTFDFNQLTAEEKTLRIVGNLPYNISTPLLFHLLQFSPIISDMHFMLQKEVVDRLTAKCNTPHWGRLSIMMQYHCQTTALFEVPPSAFQPAPKVQSAVVKLIPYAKPPFIAENYAHFADIVRMAFSKRRKMIRNSLKEKVSVTDLQKININPELRPEQLSIEDYVKISRLCIINSMRSL